MEIEVITMLVGYFIKLLLTMMFLFLFTRMVARITQ
jgi:hypothetical protein